MNSKKILGVACWLVCLVPMHYALLDAEASSNKTGLIALVGMMALLLVGYALFDSGSSKAPAEHHGHH